MISLATALLSLTMPADTTVWEERIDLYGPVSNAYLGAEVTRFGPDGRRLRLEVTDSTGASTLLFLVLHDGEGRESGALYFEGQAESPTRETFTYENGGRLQITTYYPEPGAPGERTESDLDEDGREVSKRYFRTDGSQYGEEDVLWNEDGTKQGWDFRYVEREGGTSFRYDYRAADADGAWTRRIRLRDGTRERVEVRTLLRAVTASRGPTPVPFAAGAVSGPGSEASPSFTRDGRTLVFARYGDDWTVKDPFIATLDDDGWTVTALPFGPVYNLAIAPDGSSILYATRDDEERRLYRVRRQAQGWSPAQDLTTDFGISGTYPCLTEDGDLLYFDASGLEGSGVYIAPARSGGFAAPRPYFIPERGVAFDACAVPGGGTVLVTRCVDDICEPGAENGVWTLQDDDGVSMLAQRVSALPYVWGVEVVTPLGLVVFTDGDDILALPLGDIAPAISTEPTEL